MEKKPLVKLVLEYLLSLEPTDEVVPNGKVAYIGNEGSRHIVAEYGADKFIAMLLQFKKEEFITFAEPPYYDEDFDRINTTRVILHDKLLALEATSEQEVL